MTPISTQHVYIRAHLERYLSSWGYISSASCSKHPEEARVLLIGGAQTSHLPAECSHTDVLLRSFLRSTGACVCVALSACGCIAISAGACAERAIALGACAYPSVYSADMGQVRVREARG
eukprot:1161248-Pelagomonas_calceolata.AAC.6